MDYAVNQRVNVVIPCIVDADGDLEFEFARGYLRGPGDEYMTPEDVASIYHARVEAQE